MSVRKIDANGDWTFGHGKANYVLRSNEIKQNIVTRIKSFANDWFLDMKANIDWLNILGQRSNKQTILNEISRVALDTEGVARIDTLEVTKITDRDAQILLEYTDIYNENVLLNLGLI